MLDPDAEDLIAHLCGGLAPDDRENFRRAAESTLATSPQCWGPGSIYRALVPLWRKYFHPPLDGRGTTWDQGRRASKLVNEPWREHSRDQRRSRGLGIVR